MELVVKGGLMMWVIIGAGLIATMIFMERLFHLHRAHIDASDFLEGIYNVLRRRNVVEAVSICEETPGPVAHITRTAILQGSRDRDHVTQAIEGAGLAEIPRLERNITLLGMLALITPLLGLLGTILGLMQALWIIQRDAPLVAVGDLAGGVWQALITSAAGLAVAIPAHAGYHFLLYRLESILLDMERASVNLVDFLCKPAPDEGEESG